MKKKKKHNGDDKRSAQHPREGKEREKGSVETDMMLRMEDLPLPERPMSRICIKMMLIE